MLLKNYTCRSIHIVYLKGDFCMKKLVSLMLAVVMAFSITCTAFASEPPELTEEELFRQIANNTATVTHEVRPLNSYTQEEIEQNPDLQQIFDKINQAEPYTTNTNSAYGEIYTTTIVTDMGQKVVYRSFPKVTFHVVDVGTAGSSDIFSTFNVIESVNVDGDLNTGWDNAIRYKNVKGTMGCGINTAFTNDVTLTGNSAGALSPNIKGIIDFIISVKGYDTASNIMAALGTFTYTGGRASSRDVTSDWVRCVGAKMDNEELFSDAHNLAIQSSMSTVDSTEKVNQSATAATKWTFDVYFFVGSLTPQYSNETISLNVNYLVNVK